MRSPNRSWAGGKVRAVSVACGFKPLRILTGNSLARTSKRLKSPQRRNPF